MSFVHHEPDLARDLCPGCSEPVAVEDSLRGENEFGLSCCAWFAYHRWCVLESAGRFWDVSRCAECGESIPHGLLLAGLEAVARRHSRPHDRVEPAALAWRRVPRDAPDRFRLRIPPELLPLQPAEGNDPWEEFFRNRVLDYLPVHRACVARLAEQSALRISEAPGNCPEDLG